MFRIFRKNKSKNDIKNKSEYDVLEELIFHVCDSSGWSVSEHFIKRLWDIRQPLINVLTQMKDNRAYFKHQDSISMLAELLERENEEVTNFISQSIEAHEYMDIIVHMLCYDKHGINKKLLTDFSKKYSLNTLEQISWLCEKDKRIFDVIDGEKDIFLFGVYLMGLEKLTIDELNELYKQNKENRAAFFFRVKAKMKGIDDFLKTIPNDIFETFGYGLPRTVTKILNRTSVEEERDYNGRQFHRLPTWEEASSKDLVDFILDIESKVVLGEIEDLIIKTKEKGGNTFHSMLGSILKHRNIDNHFSSHDLSSLVGLSTPQYDVIYKGLDDNINVLCYTDKNNTAETMEKIRKELVEQKIKSIVANCNRGQYEN